MFVDAFCHSDSACGTDETAEMTTHALGADDLRFAVLIKSYRLVSTIGAREIATAATNAFIAINLWEDHRLTVQIVREDHVFQFLAH